MVLFIILGIPLLAAAISILVRKQIKLLNIVAASASLLELVNVFIVVSAVIKNGHYSFLPYFSVDAFGAILMMIIGVVGFVVSFYSAGYLKIEVSKNIIALNRVREFFILLNLFILAMFFAVITTNPVLMWVSIEATTLSTAFLISFYNKPAAMEAAWKYLIINSVGLLLAFLGTLLFLYPVMASGHQVFIDWKLVLASAAKLDPFVVKMAFLFVLIGYGTKVGLVPMHTWLPDAHSKAPVPISSLLSGVLLNVALFAILRFKVIADVAIGKDFSQHLLILFGTTSIVVAAFIIFVQKNYKRLLAYSSIEHMGVIVLGFGFGGIAAFAAVLHMIYHALAKSILFLSSGNIFLKFSSTKTSKVRGVMSVLPVTGVMFMIGFLAITGMPPFGIFVTELTILSAGIQAHPVATVIAIIGLVLVFAGFLKIAIGMIFGEKDPNVNRGESGVLTIFPVVFLIVILLVLSFYLPLSLKALITTATSSY